MDKAPVYGTGDSRFDPWQDHFFSFFASGTSPVTSSFQRATLRVERRREEAVVDVEARGGVLVF